MTPDQLDQLEAKAKADPYEGADYWLFRERPYIAAMHPAACLELIAEVRQLNAVVRETPTIHCMRENRELHARVRRLEREVELLRHEGYKDATALTDEHLAVERASAGGTCSVCGEDIPQ